MSNKDEALRAKDLAEDWMRKSDFTTARRVAMKAQKMDASLENVVARIIMVCDVHCAALEKSGDEFDWYKILQVEQNADDNTIKKQYRKFALYLHPDKNQLPGAESAFKTIGEAQRVLLDKEKRRVHDMLRKPFRRPAPAQAPAPAPSFRPQQYHTPPVFQTNVNATRNSFTMGSRPENQQKPQPQPTESSGDQRFWTSCAFCHRKYEYERRFINKPVNCLGCNKQYIAFKAFFQGPPVEASFSFSQQSKVPIQKAGKAVEKQPENSARISPRKECTRAKSLGTAAEDKNGEKKRKRTVGSSDGSTSESRNKCQEVANGQHSRRSVRSKQQVSYKENNGDIKEEDAKSAEATDVRKKSHQNHLFAETLPNGINRMEKVKADQVGSSAKDSSSGSASDLAVFECADPDFTNFEVSREERCFRAGQVWAMYDPGRMPRYYAIINKVTRKPFMLKITWLEPDPDDEKAKQWVRKKLPISVGKFELGGDEEISETPSFSHLVHQKVGGMKDTVITVYPRIGETWALFRDIKWSSGCRRSSNKHEYEYVFVEILSEYAEGVAIEVGLLGKVKGFASVFCRIAPSGGSETFKILPNQLVRFSHNIPSTKLTGKEGNGVPVGSYELDTAALPQKIEELGAFPVSQEAAKSNQVHRGSPPSSQPDCVEIPSYQFHNFNDDRLDGNFAMGQIWSINCKEDGLPKYYAMIKKIIWKPLALHINWLEPEERPENVTQWRDKKMPVSVGNFTLMEGRGEILTKVAGFSHQIKVHQLIRNRYTVLPKIGEIWAMYKNWSETIKVASLKKCEYEVVEVLDDNERHIEVMMLERMDGFISVFKEKVIGGIDVKKKIPRSELLRFSHYVPAFRLTGERDGALRGCLELDVTALSRNLRRS